MEQYYIDEKTDISYILKGDSYLPELTLPAEKIDLWAYGAAAFAIYPAAQESVLHQSAGKRQAEQLSCGCGPAGRRIAFSVGRTDGGA